MRSRVYSRVRSIAASKSSAIGYVAGVLFCCVCGLAIIEHSVRSMSRAHCSLALGATTGCVSYNTVKRMLSNEASRIYLGDSHMHLAEVDGFRKFQIPGSRPGEVLTVLRYALRRGDIERAVIGLAAHHMRDNTRIVLQNPLDLESFRFQRLPFSVYFFESVLTTGLRTYLWHLLTNRSLPELNGVALRTDQQIEERAAAIAVKREKWLQSANRTGMRWWQKEPIQHPVTRWQKFNQKQRDSWTKRRFDRFYPVEDYRDGDAHAALLELFALLQERQVETCFVRMPHSEEWEALTQLDKYERYSVVQAYLAEQVRERGFRYIDTATLNLGLKMPDFRNADHVYPVVLVDATPVILDACFGDSATSK